MPNSGAPPALRFAFEPERWVVLAHLAPAARALDTVPEEIPPDLLGTESPAYLQLLPS